jgi:hypothetical protein
LLRALHWSANFVEFGEWKMMMQFWFLWWDSQNNCCIYVEQDLKIILQVAQNRHLSLSLSLSLSLCLLYLQFSDTILRVIFSTTNSSHFCDFLKCSFFTWVKRWNKFWIHKGVKRTTCKAERTSDSDMGWASVITLVSSSARDGRRRVIPWSFKKLRLPITPHHHPSPQFGSK